MSTTAARQKVFRARQTLGLAILPLEVDFDAVCAALIASGRLSEREALDRELVTAAVGEVLADWVARWKPEM
jgi:hypothetical protein